MHALIAVAKAFATFNADAVRTAFVPYADYIDTDGNYLMAATPSSTTSAASSPSLASARPRSSLLRR